MAGMIMFYILAGLAVISALFLITRENPVHAALWMLLTFFCVAGIFVQLDAEFIAVIQILVYAGAILVLYLFVVMLLNPSTKGLVKIPARLLLGVVAAVVVLVQTLTTVFGTSMFKESTLKGMKYADGITSNVKAFGVELFTKYLVPFEVASILLLVAMIGAIIIAKKD